jgi:hypothetical protein
MESLNKSSIVPEYSLSGFLLLFAPGLCLGAVSCWVGAMMGVNLKDESFFYCLLIFLFFWFVWFFIREEKGWNLLPFSGLALTLGLMFQFTKHQGLFWGIPVLSFGLGLISWKNVSSSKISPELVKILSGLLFCGMLGGWILDLGRPLAGSLPLIWLLIGISYTLITSKLISCQSKQKDLNRNPLFISIDLLLLSSNLLWLVNRVLR